jgi:HlyD family secretion protein
MATSATSRWLKWIVLLLVVCGGVALSAWYFGGDHEDAPDYKTATISRGDVVQAVTATGTLNPLVNVQVGSQISGRIVKLHADFNSKVKEGQLLAELDPATYKANLVQSDGDLAQAKANLALAQVNAKRAKELFNSKLIAESDYDKTMADLQQAEAQVLISQANVDKVKVDLARCTIYSPIDGIVISRNVDVGQTVAASMNAPILFMIANDLSKMQINASVSEADVGTIEESQEVTFTVDAFPGRQFAGKVTQVRNAAQVVQNVVTYDTIIGVDNPDLKLKPGMTANVSLITARRNGCVRIPNAALRFRPPEPSTNLTATAKLLVKLGLRKPPVSATATAAKASGTNTTGSASNQLASASVTFTGNETPEEFMKKLREAREKGEEIPESARAKMRELFQSGQMGGGGFGGGGRGGGGRRGEGGGGGGGEGRRGGGGFGGADRIRPSNRPMTRTVYTLASASAPTPGEAKPRPIQIRTGISDGVYTEVLEGLKEGETIITALNLPLAATTSQPQTVNPFGGGRGFGR